MTGPVPRLDNVLPPERSERGRILAPDLDDRRWQDLVDEATALIDRFAPQWKDRNPSDIGITLIELFAWLVESLIYRLNRVPEKHYVAFLNLLGVTRAPQRPAWTLLTFSRTGAPVTLPAGTAAQTGATATTGTAADAPVIFATETALTVVAARRIGVVRTDVVAGAAHSDASARFAGPEPAHLDLKLVEDTGAQVTLALATDDPPPATLDLYVEPFRGLEGRQPGERVEWVYSSSGLVDPEQPFDRLTDWGGWTAFDMLDDGTAGLTRPGVVRLAVRAEEEWERRDPAPGVVLPADPERPDPRAPRWVGVRVGYDPEPLPAPPAGTPPAAPRFLRLRLNRLDPNTAPAATVGAVVDERLEPVAGATPGALPVGRLARWPVHAVPGADRPYDHVRITVAGRPWSRVEYLAAGFERSYLLDPVTGEVVLGDPAPGDVPLPDAEILASYRHVATGARGNVPAGTVLVPTRDVGCGVTNPVPGRHGVDEEPIEEAKRRAPAVLRQRGRAVTAEDYEAVARAAAPGIAIVRALPPRLRERDEPGGKEGDPWTYANLQRAPGVVNVIVVPDLGPDDPRPRPSLALVQQVLAALDRSRSLATAVHISGPKYISIRVHATVEVFPTARAQGLVADEKAEQDRIERAIREYLHPVHGRGGRGWEIGQSVFISDLYQAVRPPESVGFLTSLVLAPERLFYVSGTVFEKQRPIGDIIGDRPSRNQVRVVDYELVCAGRVTVGPTGQVPPP
ncbi:baseplate J/gp47 family protein [Pseudonocardia charpentierae]|uniref:Baseplate J/gp47 family protein n=1 Tax=Pseudonocardia charpentierae TaxID=3075545 RepID=A0ABU2NGQ0_9PSEU|nr:baseplate J/gp47 family protein [Pseudonocardia sp. DSM 45834]MDT0353136.1 baseplate J/gp47 family protein [Pseudonocardia sp. DSM 45834]